jgi:curved DNA-binding protein CbpA
MDTKKDYYAILGVLPTAEDVVIRAAYKALAQRYHPDRNPGTREEATRRMAEINEAYATLSDPAERTRYDSTRTSEGAAKNAYTGEEPDADDRFIDPLQADWKIAVGYFPDLLELQDNLRKISSRLAFTFKAVLLESKAFDRRTEIAQKMEIEFLRLYFGDDPEILSFVKQLILKGNKEAAKAVNDAIRVLGKSIKAVDLISRVKREFMVPAEKPAHSTMDALRFLIDVRNDRTIAVEAALASTPSLVHAKNGDGETALHIAVDEGSLQMARLLVGWGADRQARDRINQTPLEAAIKKERTEIADYLRAAP